MLSRWSSPTRHRLDPADWRRSAKIGTNKPLRMMVDIGGGQKMARRTLGGSANTNFGKNLANQSQQFAVSANLPIGVKHWSRWFLG